MNPLTLSKSDRVITNHHLLIRCCAGTSEYNPVLGCNAPRAESYVTKVRIELIV